MKIVLNKLQNGDFSLSQKAIDAYCARKGRRMYSYKFVTKNDKDMFIRVPNDVDNFTLWQTTWNYGRETEMLEKVFYVHKMNRTDADLVAVVEELGKEANGMFADLQIMTIPDNVRYTIYNNDGIETVKWKKFYN